MRLIFIILTIFTFSSILVEHIQPQMIDHMTKVEQTHEKNEMENEFHSYDEVLLIKSKFFIDRQLFSLNDIFPEIHSFFNQRYILKVLKPPRS